MALNQSARIQTVVCIPLLDGVVEVGITEKVEEDLALVQHIKTFFTDHPIPLPPKPALSEQSTSNPATSLNHPSFFHSSPVPPVYTTADPPPNQLLVNEDDDEDDNDESDSEAETARNIQSHQNEQAGTTERSELIMQLEMSEDIRFGSPEDGSTNLDSDFQRAESARKWPSLQDPLQNTSNIQQIPPGPPPPLEDLSQEETHYSVTVSTILNNKPTRFPDTSARGSHLAYSNQSAFAKWKNQIHHLENTSFEGTSQWLLKYILFSVPFLHKKYSHEISPKSSDTFRLRKSASQDELSANHVMAERRRREKLNEKFIILRSLVPFVTKMDKASILGDTIEYLKQLHEKIQELETRKIEKDQRSRSAGNNNSVLTSEMDRTWAGRTESGPAPGSDRRKLRIVEGSGGSAKSKTVDSSPPAEVMEMAVEVSIIESDALLELQCGYREGLLLDIMEKLRELGIEVTTVQSSLNITGVLVAELRAKVGKKTSIMEVKRAIKQIILIPRDSEI
ncbi:hypothetical protein ACFE04_014192 [Oxalis oulophora]